MEKPIKELEQAKEHIEAGISKLHFVKSLRDVIECSKKNCFVLCVSIVLLEWGVHLLNKLIIKVKGEHENGRTKKED